MNLQVIEGDFFYKIILIEASLIVSLEFRDGGVQPDRLAQVELIAGCIQSLEDLVGSRLGGIVLYYGILQ